MKYKKMIRSNHRLLTNVVLAESYRYDALGRRTATVNAEGTERHIWDGDHCLADIDERGEVIRAYLWGPGVDNLLAVRVGGRNYAALTDIQGTVWGYADERGEIVARWTYDAWGNVLSEEIAESADALRFVRYRFQGREFSRATGLTNFRARWYDPTTGRWLSKDPIGLSGGLNLYAFCGNNPMNANDPTGLESTTGSAFFEGWCRGSQGVVNAFTGGFFDPSSGLLYDWFNKQWDDQGKDTNECDPYFGSGGFWGRIGVGCFAGGAFSYFGLNPWLGTAALHGPHHGMGNHFEAILRVGSSKVLKMFVPGKGRWFDFRVQ